MNGDIDFRKLKISFNMVYPIYGTMKDKDINKNYLDPHRQIKIEIDDSKIPYFMRNTFHKQSYEYFEYDMSSIGHIYVLSNKAFPDLLKIGYTTQNINTRIKQLYTTGVPYEFNVVYLKKVRHPKIKEQNLHEKLKTYRVNSGREFFKIGKSELYKYIVEIEGDMIKCPYKTYSMIPPFILEKPGKLLKRRRTIKYNNKWITEKQKLFNICKYSFDIKYFENYGRNISDFRYNCFAQNYRKLMEGSINN